MTRDQQMQPLLVMAGHVLQNFDPAMRFEILRVMIDALAHLLLVRHWLELDHGEVAARFEATVLVEHIGDTAGHPGREIAAGLAEDHDDAAGHVLAAMVAGALDDGDSAGITHREALPGDAAEITFALDRAIEHRIADDDRFLRHNARVGGGADDDSAAGEALADVIVGVAFELERHAARKPRAEALAGSAGEFHVDGVGRESLVPIPFRNFAGEHRPRGSIGILDRGDDPDGSAMLERSLSLRDQLAVEDSMDLVVLPFAIMNRHARARPRLEEQPGEIEALGLPVLDDLTLVEHLHLSDHFDEGAKTHGRHQVAHLFGDEEEEIDDVLRLADEALAQHRILGCDADRTGIEVTLAHHQAAGRDERRRREAELIGAQEGANDDVAAGADAAVDLNRDAAA